MLMRPAFDAQEALACTMVLIAAADGAITDEEIATMATLVQTLPVFQGFSSARLTQATDAAVRLLGETDGLSHGAALIRDALDSRLRETAYALACDVIAADAEASQDSLQMLEFIGGELHIDPLVAAGIERGARARHRRLAA